MQWQGLSACDAFRAVCREAAFGRWTRQAAFTFSARLPRNPGKNGRFQRPAVSGPPLGDSTAHVPFLPDRAGGRSRWDIIIQPQEVTPSPNTEARAHSRICRARHIRRGNQLPRQSHRGGGDIDRRLRRRRPLGAGVRLTGSDHRIQGLSAPLRRRGGSAARRRADPRRHQRARSDCKGAQRG